MRVLWFDPVAGVSGDMTVGAMLALGVPLATLREGLRALPVRGYQLLAREVEVNGIVAMKFDVVEPGTEGVGEGDAPHAGPSVSDNRGSHERTHSHGGGHEHSKPHAHGGAHGHRSWREIRSLLERADLDRRVQEVALRIFGALAVAEGQIHGKPPEEVSFHEVGAIDSIVDIVATAIGFVHLGVERAYVGSLPLGSGTVRAQHGMLPVPGPATVELLRGFSTRPGDGLGELVTPTGAAIVAGLCTPGPIPELRILASGYGSGSRSLPDRPNVLRLVLAEESGAPERSTDGDALVLVETNLDDCPGEWIGHAVEELMAAGARDVWITPIQMKKNRPGVILSLLAEERDRARLVGIVFRETSALGVRFRSVERQVLRREFLTVETEFGPVVVKTAEIGDGSRRAAPEYEDCRRVARDRGIPLRVVYEAAVAAVRRLA